MKNKKIIISVVVVLLLAVGCACLYAVWPEEEKKSEPENIEVFDRVTAEIIEYSVTDRENQFVLVKNEGEWKIRGNELAILDQTKVTELMGNVSLISVKNVESDIDATTFEAQKKQEVKIVLADGEEFVFEFAELASDKCALRISGHDDIYAAHMSLRDILVAKLENLRVAVIFEGLLKETEEMSYYSFTDYDKTKTVVRTKTAYEISANKTNSYVMETPYARDVDDEKFEQQISVIIPRLSAQKYVENPSENLEDYGLDSDSRAVLNFRWGSLDESLFLGKSEGSMVYAMKKGTDEIFLINSSNLAFLNTEPFYLLEPCVLDGETENITSFSIHKGETAYDVKIRKASDGTNQYYINEKAASENAFLTLRNKLSEISLKSELLTVPEVADKISLTIVFSNGQKRQTLTFVPNGEKDYAMFENGTAKFAVDKSTVDGFIAELDTISKNPLQTGGKG